MPIYPEGQKPLSYEVHKQVIG
ncbi:MAG: hypothetical protein METHSR3v1_1770010, partial [Methanothrix sp.]